MSHCYRRKGIRTLDYILSNPKHCSLRYLNFRRSKTCVSCGLKGTYFAKERHWSAPPSTPYHYNLYGVNSEGVEIMLTRDHIIPKALGGTNGLDNSQTLCEVCNTKKGASLPWEFYGLSKKNALMPYMRPIWTAFTSSLSYRPLELARPLSLLMLSAKCVRYFLARLWSSHTEKSWWIRPLRFARPGTQS